MYKLKQIPEDFIVIEIPTKAAEKVAGTKGSDSHQPTIGTPSSGSYMYFKLRKRNWNTLDAVKEIARVLKNNENTISVRIHRGIERLKKILEENNSSNKD